MIVFRTAMPHNSHWISCADTRWIVGGHLVTEVSGEIPVSIFMVAQRGRSFSDIWTFNDDEYFYCDFLCYATV